MFYRNDEGNTNSIEINEEKLTKFLISLSLVLFIIIIFLFLFLTTPKVFKYVKEIYDNIERGININNSLVKIEGVIIYLTKFPEKEKVSGYIYNNGYIIQIDNLPEGFEEKDRVLIEGNVIEANFPLIFVEKARKIRSNESISVEEIKIGKIPPKGKLVKVKGIKVEINDVKESYGRYLFHLTLDNFNGYYVAKTEEEANRIMNLNNSYTNVTFALISMGSTFIPRVFQIF